MKNTVKGAILAAMLALSLVASAGEAFAADVQSGDNAALVTGRGKANGPRGLGATWE